MGTYRCLDEDEQINYLTSGSMNCFYYIGSVFKKNGSCSVAFDETYLEDISE